MIHFYKITGIGVLISIVFAASAVCAETVSDSIEGVYLGRIGKQTVVLEMSQIFAGERRENYANASDSQIYPISGIYFYRRHGVSIQLVGLPLPDGSLRLREYKQLTGVTDEFSAEWRLTVRGDIAAGVLCKCDLSHMPTAAGPLVSISLKRISRKLIPDKQWEAYKPGSGNTFYDLLLDSPLKTGPEVEVAPGIAYKMQIDPRFHVSQPQLTHYPDHGVMTRMNRDLQSEFTYRQLWTAACLSAGELHGTFGGSYAETATVVGFLPDIFSVVVKRFWYCGAAHGNGGVYALNYNLHTGKRFILDTAFQTAGGSSAEPELAALFLKLYERHYSKSPDAYSGSYIGPSGVAVPMDCKGIIQQNMLGDSDSLPATLYLTETGLVIRPVLPCVLDSCGAEITIPYSELRPFIERQSILHSWVESRFGNASATN